MKPAFEDTTPVDASAAAPSGGKPAFEDTMPVDQQAGGGDYWGDVRKNAVEGLKEIPQGAANFADNALGAANAMTPMAMGKSIFQMAGGTPAAETDTGQGVRGAADLIKGTASGLWQQAKDVGSTAVMPLQMATGTPPAETMAGQNFRKRPLSFSFDVASAPFMARSLFGKGKPAGAAMAAASDEPVASAATPKAPPSPEPSIPNFLETKGGQGINQLAGIRGNTVTNMARTAENPGSVGTNLAKVMASEGAIGKTATETFSKASKVANEYGKKVDQAVQAIKDANKGLGVYPELEDSLKVESNQLLKPILDQANALRESGYPNDRFASRGWRAMYDSLSKKSESANGFLTLEDVRDELHKVGSMYDTAGPNNLGIIDQLYGHLAGIREDMVNDIASRVGDPRLAKDFLDANAGYSRYMRVLPDIRKAAGAESVGQMNLGGLFKNFKESLLSGPTASRAVMKAGSILKSEKPAEMTPVLSDKTLTPEMARDFLRQAQGNKEAARYLAHKKGYKF